MCRYLLRLMIKLSRILRSFFTHFVYRLLNIKPCNYKPLIIYFLLVGFSTIILVYKQSDGNLLKDILSQTSIEENEIIQVKYTLKTFSLKNS